MLVCQLCGESFSYCAPHHEPSAASASSVPWSDVLNVGHFGASPHTVLSGDTVLLRPWSIVAGCMVMGLSVVSPLGHVGPRAPRLHLLCSIGLPVGHSPEYSFCAVGNAFAAAWGMDSQLLQFVRFILSFLCASVQRGCLVPFRVVATWRLVVSSLGVLARFVLASVAACADPFPFRRAPWTWKVHQADGGESSVFIQ